MRTRSLALAAIAAFVLVNLMQPRSAAQSSDQPTVVRAVAPVFPFPEKGNLAVGSN